MRFHFIKYFSPNYILFIKWLLTSSLSRSALRISVGCIPEKASETCSMEK